MVNSRQNEVVLMLCTAARGGMRTVVESYRDDGLFDRWNVKLIFTHDEGGWIKKLYMFTKALFIYSYYIFFTRVALVHNHSAMRGSFWRKNVFSAIARLRSVPVILHLHGSEMESFYSNSSDRSKRMISNILSNVSSVMVLSNSWSAFIEKIAPKAQVDIIYNYVKVPDRHTESMHDGVVKILFLGLLGKRKGIYDLVEVANRLKNKGLSFEFWIGGNGEFEKVNSLVEENKLTDCIKMLGWIDKQTKEQYLEKTDIYILPSYNEGLPMSVLEAMSWQIPVISTSVGGIPELIRDREDGFIVEPGNLDQIESALEELIASESLRLTMGKSAKSRIESGFSKEVIHPKIDALYKKVGNWS